MDRTFELLRVYVIDRVAQARWIGPDMMALSGNSLIAFIAKLLSGLQLFLPPLESFLSIFVHVFASGL